MGMLQGASSMNAARTGLERERKAFEPLKRQAETAREALMIRGGATSTSPTI
jgi:hypothetical protein